jgi:hypothetical protein
VRNDISDNVPSTEGNDVPGPLWGKFTRPLFANHKTHEPLGLHDGDIVVETTGGSLTLPGIIAMNWLPTPSIECAISMTPEFMPLDGLADDPTISVPLQTVPDQLEGQPDYDALWAKNTMGTWFSVPEVKVLEDSPVPLMAFNLIGSVFGSRSVRTEQVRDGEWRFVIHPHGGSGGRGLRNYSLQFTHFVLLERIDGKSFRWKQARTVVEDFVEFLSFVAGRKVGAALFVGIGDDLSKRWARWKVFESDPPGQAISWSPDSWEQLGKDEQQLLPLFMQRMRDPNWGDFLRRALRYRLLANDGHIDTRIVMSAAGLEVVAWAALVAVDGWVPRKVAANAEAADLLRMLLMQMQLDLAIPDAAASATQECRRRKQTWDGPELVTKVRNETTHSKNLADSLPDDVRNEAAAMSQMYLELALLWVFDYQGSYRDRLTYRTQRVPWAKGEPKHPGG